MQNLERAWLTHSFHCCAFQFPSRHDPMRHVQQLALVEKFKYECKAKGYSQPPSDALMLNDDFGSSEVKSSLTRERRAIIRWVRSSDSAENDSLTGISTIAHHFDEPEEVIDSDFDGGVFHEPATAPNDYLEAICGNLTLT